MIHQIEQDGVHKEVVLNSKRLMLLDVYADWCIPCEMQLPVLHELDKKYRDLEIYKLNADESQSFTTLNSITSIPTMILYKDGEEKERLVGLNSLDTLSELIDEYLE